MNSALIVGDQGSGLTTFVGLLYTAQVRLGTETADKFRFHADRDTIQQLEAIYGELGAGRFPERDFDWEQHPLSFALGFRNGGFHPLTGHEEDESGDFGVVRVQVAGISTQEMADLREHDAVLGESTRRLLRSQVIIPLVDATSLPKYSSASRSAPLVRYDHQLAATLELLGRFLTADRNRKARKMHLLFVLTKLDRCTPESIAEWGGSPGPTALWSTADRQKVGWNILERFLPETGHFIASSLLRDKNSIELPVWYFSGLRTMETGAAPRIVRRSRLPFGGWEPEYPFEEYRALIEHLALLGRRLPRALEA